MSSQQEARLGRTGDDTASLADDMKQRIKNRADEVVESGREYLHEAEDRLKTQVQERPVTTLLAAAGIGLLIGLILARRSH
jgi:ElaB/YqjD/DUF883 family membrane-anchored ribosome-binding protein